MNTSKKTFALSSLTLRILTLGCFATAAFFGLRSTWSQPPQLLPTVTADSSSFVPSIQSPPSLETQNIEDIRLGQRVVGTNPLREQTQPASDIDPATWRAVRLNMIQGGIEYDLAFLRPLSWLEATGAEVGGSIHMELHEMGLDGPAQVTAINPCPEIEADDGTGRNVVTGTMAHPGPNILYLDITGLNEPLGVTDTHPIWSESRQDFVVAGLLEVGEQFRTLTGDSATLTKIHPHRGPPEMVFNLEVDGEHVYSVAGTGLLVHNDCVDLYRAVSPEEYADIMAHGGFRAGPNSLSVKQFGHNLDEVIAVTDQLPLRNAAAVVKTSVPRHIFDLLDHTRVDEWALKSGATSVPNELLDWFNSKLTSEITHAF